MINILTDFSHFKILISLLYTVTITFQHYFFFTNSCVCHFLSDCCSIAIFSPFLQNGHLILALKDTHGSTQYLISFPDLSLCQSFQLLNYRPARTHVFTMKISQYGLLWNPYRFAIILPFIKTQTEYHFMHHHFLMGAPVILTSVSLLSPWSYYVNNL